MEVSQDQFLYQMKEHLLPKAWETTIDFTLSKDCAHTVLFIDTCRSAEGEAEKRGLSVKTEHAEVTVIPDMPRDSQTSDSDSDGPILYRDEDEEEEEDEYTSSTAVIFFLTSCWTVRSTRKIQKSLREIAPTLLNRIV